MDNKIIYGITSTSTKPLCYHHNGWYKTVRFNWWIFNFKKNVFWCIDCKDLIDMKEVNALRKQEQKQYK